MASGSVSVCSKTYVCDLRPRLPFRIVSKRYWVGELPADADDCDTFAKTREDVRTLVLIHGISSHKEHWEPTVQRLFEHERATSTGTSARFRDMWALDMPNHGDSAVLNEEVLRWGYDVFSWEDNARCVHAFLAGLGRGVDVDFSRRRLTLVGHSMGGTVSIIMPTYYPVLNISSLHLFEPYLVGERGPQSNLRLIPLSAARDDIWSSTEAAYQALKKRQSFLGWDDRILKKFVMHGLRPLPTVEYPDKLQGVTLKCTKKQQAATYKDLRSFGVAYRLLSHMLKEIETHIVYGSITDMLPYEAQQDVLHVASGGISNLASAITAPG